MAKLLIAVLALAAIGAGIAVYVSQDSDESDGRPAAAPVTTDAAPPAPDAATPAPEGELSGSACRRLAGLTERLAADVDDPVAFLRRLGSEAAGIREGNASLIDLARGGENLIPGKGFREEFDDGTTGQARHFAGIAVAATFGGASPTRWISEHLRRDPADSADGRLTEEGISFASQIRRGDLPLAEAPAWLVAHLCA